MNEDLRPPYRIQFDNARDPYTARNALGIAGTGAGLITSVTSPLSVTGGNLTVDLSAYGDVFLAANQTFTGTNTFTTIPVYIGSNAANPGSGPLTVNGAGGGSTSSITIANWASSAAATQINTFKSRGGGTVGTQGAVAVSDGLHLLTVFGSDGSAFKSAGSISFVCEGTPSTTIPSRLVISTASASANTERLRIDSAGLATFAGDTTSANYPAGAWTAWTPTITAGSGTLTSSTINRARYTQHGKTVTAFLDVSITNAGTGTGGLVVTLPVTASAYNAGSCVVFGRESAALGVMVQGYILSTTTVGISRYDAATIIVTGYRVHVTMIYEAA